MERGEKIGLGVAGAGHVILFGLLSIGFLATPNPLKLKSEPVEVSLVKDVGLEATAPQAVEPPAQSIAPDQGEPEDAAPPAPMEAAPEPAPALAAPPAPAAKPAPVAKPRPPKPVAEKASSKPTPSKRTAAVTPRTPPAAVRGSGSSADAKAARPRGSRLGDDFLKGLTTEPSRSRSQTPRAAKIDARAMASIVQAIARQIQPCADRQVNPGPGANEITTVLNLRLSKDGTLAATPTMVRQSGLSGENQRYAQRVTDLGIAAFKGCSPLRLPPEFYDTPNGGWNNINYNWKLR